MSLEHEIILVLPDDEESYLLAKSLRFRFMDDRMEWCRDKLSRECWDYVPPVWRTCIFKFEHAEDATAFKLRFQT